ncbi:MAG: phosphatidylglycerophosphatase A [Polyangiaceae bacterium]|jgi:phosphatidylglycerophosphatase A
MKSKNNRLAWVIATWFGCGLVPRAPGTAGAVGALPLYALVIHGGRVGVGLTAFVVAVTGLWAASLVARESSTQDPQFVVIDEVAGMLVTMTPMAHLSLGAVGMGFVLFRFFDIVKPWPVRYFERFPGGWGIMLDDLVAGALSAVLLAGAQALGMLA